MKVCILCDPINEWDYLDRMQSVDVILGVYSSRAGAMNAALKRMREFCNDDEIRLEERDDVTVFIDTQPDCGSPYDAYYIIEKEIES